MEKITGSQLTLNNPDYSLEISGLLVERRLTDKEIEAIKNDGKFIYYIRHGDDMSLSEATIQCTPVLVNHFGAFITDKKLPINDKPCLLASWEDEESPFDFDVNMGSDTSYEAIFTQKQTEETPDPC